VLVTALILLVLVTLAGIIAVSSSTVDTQIASNSRRVTMAFQGAEGGVNLAIPIIEDTILNATLSPSGPTGPITALDTANLEREILGDGTVPADTVTATPDVTMASLGGTAVRTDIDWMYSNIVEGGAAQFAMGYQGIGAGASAAGAASLYRLNSEGAR
jgi:Tfp pilus assembly protein PilX